MNRARDITRLQPAKIAQLAPNLRLIISIIIACALTVVDNAILVSVAGGRTAMSLD